MDWLEWLTLRDWRVSFIIALLACGVMFVVFKKREEFSHHAVSNTAATILVAGTNVIATILFTDEINAFCQKLYWSVGIPHLSPTFWDQIPLWLVCIVGIAAKDLVDYWNHRVMHTKWVWPTHAAHHSDTYVNAFTTYRVHFLEQIVMTASYIVLLTWLQMPQALPFVAVFATLHNMYVHMDLPFEHGPLKYLIASPVFHRWHHADTPKAYGKNLANIMPIYDKLFGTYLAEGKCNAPMGALSAGINDKNPLAIYIYPFQEWGRLIRKAVLRRRSGLTKLQFWIAQHSPLGK